MLKILPFVFALFALTFADNNSTVCDGVIPRTFNLADVLGTWYVAGVMTYGQHTLEKANPCFRVEFFEADEAGLRWLLKNYTKSNESDWSARVKGITIRQRYHIDHPYDTWSMNVGQSNGCFEEVLTIYSDKTKIVTSRNGTLASKMQLHLLPTHNDLGPYLVQLLWGDILSAVVYRRRPGRVTRPDLDPAAMLLTKFRLGQFKSYACEKTPA